MILDTLFLVFKGDTQNLKTAEKEATGTVKKYSEEIKKANASTQLFGSALTNAFKKFAGTAASLVSLGSIIHGIKSATEYTLQLSEVSKSLNANVSTLDVWQRAVKQSGGTAEGFSGTIKGLSEKFNLSADNVIKSLPKIADLFSRLNNLQARKLASQMGIDGGTLYLLQKGSKGVQELIAKQRELGVVTKKDTEVALAFRRQWEDVHTVFRSIFTQLATDILPIVTKVAQVFEWLGLGFEENKNLIYAAGVVLVGFMTARLIPTLWATAAAEWAVLAPILPLVVAWLAAAAALVLIVDDLRAYYTGHKSVTGAIVEHLKHSVAFQHFLSGLKITVEVINAAFWGLVHAVQATFGWIMKLGNAITGMKKDLNLKVDHQETRVQNLATKETQDLILHAQTRIKAAASNPFTASPYAINAMTAGVGGTKNDTVNFTIQTLNVETQAKDPQEFSKDVEDVLKGHFKQALHGMTSGMRI